MSMNPQMSQEMEGMPCLASAILLGKLLSGVLSSDNPNVNFLCDPEKCPVLAAVKKNHFLLKTLQPRILYPDDNIELPGNCPKAEEINKIARSDQEGPQITISEM